MGSRHTMKTGNRTKRIRNIGERVATVLRPYIVLNDASIDSDNPTVRNFDAD
jgi:hypothetical protein